jgi:hypothetical protein
MAASVREAEEDSLPPQAEARPAAVDSVRRIVDKATRDKAAQVRRSLAKQRPVLFIMPQPEAGKLVGDLWVPLETGEPTPGKEAHSRCGNTLVIVAYDDARYGGAFELLRDCGATMYEESAFWLRYGDFNTLCHCAVELVTTPDAKPATSGGAAVATDSMLAVAPHVHGERATATPQKSSAHE